MYEDPMKNRNDLLAFLLGEPLEQFLTEVEPSQELVHLFGAMNHDFIHRYLKPDVAFLWIERIQPVPGDLVRAWQDYDYISSLWPRRHLRPRVQLSFWRQISGRVMEQVLQCPLLLHIAGALLWNHDIDLTAIHHLLDVSWVDVCAALCRLRPILRDRLSLSDLPALLIQDWMTTQQGTWRSNICRQLAQGCIRVRKLIDTGRLPEDGLWMYEIPWGRFIRGSPVSPELLRGVQEFVPPPIPNYYCGLPQECECHDVMMWLKSFPEPPLDEIRRWQNLFESERKAASKRQEYAPPEDYDERWREWEEEYPEVH
ncbi:hypothetical protein DFH09DRAFT_527347 [Mycena vulgaris]|nr:hypothetical protein DFH09DRAFT_527347 [Mycena vulgaris]